VGGGIFGALPPTPGYLPRVKSARFTAMFTLVDVQDLCSDEEMLFANNRVPSGTKVCTCGQPVGSKWHFDRGRAHRRCSDRFCHLRVYGKSDWILES